MCVLESRPLLFSIQRETRALSSGCKADPAKKDKNDLGMNVLI